MFLHTFTVYLLALASVVAGYDKTLSYVRRAFEAANIPATLGLDFNPRFLLEVLFPQPNEHTIALHVGAHFPRNATAILPSFEVVGHAGHGPFIVAMLDPDVPTPQDPNLAQIRHYFGTDFFTGKGQGDGDAQAVHRLFNRTAAITPYFQPTPIPSSDAHRYIFLLFKQPPGFAQQSLVTPTAPITLFNISSFVDATGLGAPIAGSFMLVAPDPSEGAP